MQSIILFFALAAYALLGIVPLLFCAVPGYFFLRKGKVPINEAMGLSLITAIGLVLAYTPFVMRADQWLAADGVQQIAYLKKNETYFEAIASNAPNLDFDGAKAINQRRHFKVGTRHAPLSNKHFGIIQPTPAPRHRRKKPD